MKDSWKSGDLYEYFTSHWSSLAARGFLDWLSPAPGLKWLNVSSGGCQIKTALFKSEYKDNHKRDLSSQTHSVSRHFQK